MKRLLIIFAVLLTMAGCAKKPVTAPVPGSLNTLDAYAYRIISDSQASLMSIKSWEMCSDAKFPASVTFDNQTVPCDSKAGAFPVGARQYLLTAEQAYNTAAGAAKAYHSGASSDVQGLSNAINDLSKAISDMLAKTGAKQ